MVNKCHVSVCDNEMITEGFCSLHYPDALYQRLIGWGAFSHEEAIKEMVDDGDINSEEDFISNYWNNIVMTLFESGMSAKDIREEWWDIIPPH